MTRYGIITIIVIKLVEYICDIVYIIFIGGLLLLLLNIGFGLFGMLVLNLFWVFIAYMELFWSWQYSELQYFLKYPKDWKKEFQFELL